MFYIYSPMEQFEVYSIVDIYYPINVFITNYSIYNIFVLVFICIFYLVNSNNNSIIYNKLSIWTEIIYDSTYSLFISQSIYTIYYPFIFSIFNYILFSNLFGNLPYGYTISSSIIYTMGFSTIIFFGTLFNSIILYGYNLLGNFIPNNIPFVLMFILCPIELISYCAKAVSLGVRLWANMVAGHSLLHILAGFLFTLFTTNIIVSILTIVPFVIFILIVILELAVSVIQAYVFSILVSSYINESFNIH